MRDFLLTFLQPEEASVMDGAINYSVGRHGRNHRHDVIVVQMLLNNHLAVIGPRPKLSVDGVCAYTP